MEQFNTSKSKQLFNQLKGPLLDGTASSFHKAAYEEYPVAMSYGKGSKLYDVDGNEYIDYILGLGPMILGYCPEALNAAVKSQIDLGSHFSAPTEDLLALSRKLIDIIPCAEVVSYQNTGTEANMFAFRVARAYTGKDKIIKFEGQYHGWSDEEKISIDADRLADLGPRNRPNKIIHGYGQPQSTTNEIIVLPWNDLVMLERTLKHHGAEIAAIIMEPLMCDSGPILPAKGYLEGVRKLATEYEVVLIFDEVITGFRLALGGAQEYYNVTPDIATFAKAISGGYPLAVIAGKKEIMAYGVHASGTFNGNPISVIAALATIKEMDNPDTYDHFESLGKMLTEGIKELGNKYKVKLFTTHMGAICVLIFGEERAFVDFRDYLQHNDMSFYNKFVSRSKDYGIRLTPKRGRIYLSKAHSIEDIQKTLKIFEQVFIDLTGLR